MLVIRAADCADYADGARTDCVVGLNSLRRAIRVIRAIRGLTVTIDLASPLLPFTTQAVNPVSFVISDGVQTFTQSNEVFAPTFRFATDGLGNISSWFVSAALTSTQPSSAGYEEDIVLCRPSPIICTSYYDRVSLYNLSSVLVGSGQNSQNVGSWTISTASSGVPVPEPTTLTLLTSVLVGLGLYSRRRKARWSDSALQRRL